MSVCLSRQNGCVKCEVVMWYVKQKDRAQGKHESRKSEQLAKPP